MNQRSVHTQFVPPQPDYMDAQQHFLHSWRQFADTHLTSADSQYVPSGKPMVKAPISPTDSVKFIQNSVQSWQAPIQRQMVPTPNMSQGMTRQTTFPSGYLLEQLPPTAVNVAVTSTLPLSGLPRGITKPPRRKKKKIAAHHTFSCSLASSTASPFTVKTTNSLTLQELSNVLKKRQNPNHMMERPIFSYSFLIALSLLSSPKNQLTLSEICQWITEAFPYFKYSRSINWRNSIRHNLSLNGAFQKTTKSSDGKSHLWTFQEGHEGKYFKDLDMSFEELRIFLQGMDLYFRPMIYAGGANNGNSIGKNSSSSSNTNSTGVNIAYDKFDSNIGNTFHRSNSYNALTATLEQRKSQRHINYLPTPPLTDNTPPRKGSLHGLPQIRIQAPNNLPGATNKRPEMRIQDLPKAVREEEPMTLLKPISVTRATAPTTAPGSIPVPTPAPMVFTSTPNRGARLSVDATGKIRSIDEHLDLLKTPQFGDNIRDSILRLPMISPRRMEVMKNGFDPLNPGDFRIDNFF